MLKFRHPFHLVQWSPWPFAMSWAVLAFLVGWIGYVRISGYCLLLGFFSIIIILFFWIRDVIRENKEGHHTLLVYKGFLVGFLLFLCSEIMVFFGFFWSYFHHALSPVWGWPTVGIDPVHPYQLPLLGTLLLLVSGIAATVAHHTIVVGDKALTFTYLSWTLIMGFAFLFVQATEYKMAPFSIYDAGYGSVFFMTTGLHGIHVFVGLIFITIVTWHIAWSPTGTKENHLGLDLALFYWHMVDIVWLFVYLVYYWWPFS